jgi:hypothetical protein
MQNFQNSTADQNQQQKSKHLKNEPHAPKKSIQRPLIMIQDKNPARQTIHPKKSQHKHRSKMRKSTLSTREP